MEAGCVTLILITASHGRSVTGSENRLGKKSVYVGTLILTIFHSPVFFFTSGQAS